MVFGLSKSPALSPNVAGFTAILSWIGAGLLVATTAGVPPFLLCSIVFIGSFLIMIPVWKLRGDRVIDKFKVSPRAYLLGIFGMCNVLFWYFGLKNAPVMEANLLNYLWPALIILFTALYHRHWPDRLSVLGCAACLLGCYFIFSSDGGLSFAFGGIAGLVSATLGAVIWAIYSVLTRHMDFPSDRVAVFTFFAGFFAIALHLLTEETVWPVGLQWLSVLGLVVCQLSYIFWDYAMKKGRVKLLASVSYFIPLFSTLLLTAAGYGVLSHHVAWGAVGIIGGCLIVNSRMLLHSFKRAKPEAAE